MSILIEIILLRVDLYNLIFMKYFVFISILFFSTSAGFSQILPKFEKIPLENKEDFNSEANDAALAAANYLLNTPIEKESFARLRCQKYLMEWMSGSPDYSFVIDEVAMKISGKNSDLLLVFLACMTKFVLENEEDSKDQDLIKLNSVKTFIAYAKDKDNKVKVNKEVKKMMAAEERGELKEYLNL